VHHVHCQFPAEPAPAAPVGEPGAAPLDANRLPDWAKSVLAAAGGTLTALVAATLPLLSGFNVWRLTQAEISAVVGLATALLVVITALFARSQVTPT
jgi:hypothetical protein